ncbi:MAG: hypothetical protein U0414_27615 [Polyangiaceae bacterium]
MTFFADPAVTEITRSSSPSAVGSGSSATCDGVRVPRRASRPLHRVQRR